MFYLLDKWGGRKALVETIIFFLAQNSQPIANPKFTYKVVWASKNQMTTTFHTDMIAINQCHEVEMTCIKTPRTVGDSRILGTTTVQLQLAPTTNFE